MLVNKSSGTGLFIVCMEQKKEMRQRTNKISNKSERVQGKGVYCCCCLICKIVLAKSNQNKQNKTTTTQEIFFQP